VGSTSPTSAGRVFTSLPKTQKITSIQHKNFLLQKIFDGVIHPTLHDIFTKQIWETKLQNETLEQYIFSQPSPPSNKEYKNSFNKGQLKKIDDDPNCDRFDICLYLASYSLTAKFNTKLNLHPYKDKLKDKLKEVKDIRNNLLHDLLIVSELEIENNVTKLSSLMPEILDLIGIIFGCRDETNKHKRKVKKHMKKIMKIRVPLF